MKVLHIINSLGDSGQYFIPFFEGLIRRGHYLIVISPTISPLMCTKLSQIGVDFVTLGEMPRGLSSMSGIIRFPLILSKIMKIIINENVHIIHLHSTFIPLLLGCIVSNLKKIPLVLTIHGGQPSFSFRLNPIHQIHGIISTSIEQKVALPQELKEATVIPLPINLERFFPYSKITNSTKNQYRISLFNSGAPNTVVYKLLRSADRISKSFENVEIKVIGWYSNYLELVNTISKTNEEIGREMIVMAGFIEDSPKAMNDSDIVIGVGVVVAEAMACGKPVIVARDSFGGIINEKNVDVLRRYNFTGRNNERPSEDNIFESINMLLKDEKYMKHLGEFGRKYAEKEFEPAKIAMKVESVYKHAQKKAKETANFSSLFLLGWNTIGLITYIYFKEVLNILKNSNIMKYFQKILMKSQPPSWCNRDK